MKRILKTIPLILICSILVSCRTVYVASDQVRGTDFSTYRSYAWLPFKDTSASLYNNDVVKENIRQVMNAELRARGTVYEENNPDFLVQVSLRSEEKEEIRSYYNPHPWYWPPYGYRPQQEQINYTKNTIIIDMIDKKSNQLVWRGWTSRNNSFPYTNMVKEILVRFPVNKHPQDDRYPDSPVSSLSR